MNGTYPYLQMLAGESLSAQSGLGSAPFLSQQLGTGSCQCVKNKTYVEYQEKMSFTTVW